MSDIVATTLAKAIEQEHAGKPEAALATFNAAIAEGINEVLIHSNRGLLLERMGKHQNALESFKNAYRLEANFRDHYNAGNMLLQLEQFEDAIAEFESSIAFRKDYPDCWCNKGIAHNAIGNLDTAISDFNKALEINSAFYSAHRCLAIIQANAGKTDESLAHYRQAAEAAPELASAWFEYGCALYKTFGEGQVFFDPQGPEGLTVNAFDKALELDPSISGAWGRKIGVQFRLADAAQATDRANPKPDSIKLLPLILADLSTTLHEARQRFPEDPWFQERENDLNTLQAEES